MIMLISTRTGWTDSRQYFYSFNYAAQPFDAHPESANRCAPVLSKKWNPVWVADYAAEPSPAMHILARKDEQLNDLAIAARGAELFVRVSRQKNVAT